MKHVRVRITADGREAEIHPMYDVLANAPFVRRATALQWNVTQGGLGILHHVEGDADAFDAAAAAIDPVVDHEVEPAGSDAFYAYVRDELTDASRALFEAISGHGIVVVPPIRYHEDGHATLSLFGPAAVVERSVTGLPDPVSLSVEAVGGLTGLPVGPETRLSDRQAEAVAAAVDLGYYDVPRTAGQADVAAAIDCAPSTAAEHLRKAEATLVRAAFRFR